MKAFKHLREDLVNYNHHHTAWQVRHDDTKSMKYQDPHVYLKDATPHIDHEAHEAGKMIYAYMHGTDTKKPDLSNHIKREVKFNRGSIEKPFIHTDDHSPVKKADYVEFHGKKVNAYYKKRNGGS